MRPFCSRALAQSSGTMTGSANSASAASAAELRNSLDRKTAQSAGPPESPRGKWLVGSTRRRAEVPPSLRAAATGSPRKHSMRRGGGAAGALSRPAPPPLWVLRERVPGRGYQAGRLVRYALRPRDRGDLPDRGRMRQILGGRPARRQCTAMPRGGPGSGDPGARPGIRNSRANADRAAWGIIQNSGTLSAASKSIADNAVSMTHWRRSWGKT
jgi:hypothetical protein